MRKISGRRALIHKWDMRRTASLQGSATISGQRQKDCKGQRSERTRASVSGQGRTTALLNSKHLGLPVQDSREIKPINTAAQKGKELRASPLRIYGQLASGKGESVFFKVWSLVNPPAPGDVPTPRSIWAAQTESSGYIKKEKRTRG